MSCIKIQFGDSEPVEARSAILSTSASEIIGLRAIPRRHSYLTVRLAKSLIELTHDQIMAQPVTIHFGDDEGYIKCVATGISSDDDRLGEIEIIIDPRQQELLRERPYEP